ncbi:MAG TPA: S49 family peptidase, partial [Chloroflexota bacterium]
MRFLSLNQVWAIEPAAARSYLEIYAAVLARKDAGLALTQEELKARGISGLGTVGDSRAIAVQDGVATINVRGPIVPHADLFDQMSGVASVEGIRAQIGAIMADDSIKSWVCAFDSPGGVVTGIGALAETIRQVCAVKPGVAFVEGMATSAANWLAAGFTQRVVDKSAWMGSIGCIMGWTDDRAMKEMVGLKDIKFISSDSPDKNPDPTTDAGKAVYQKLVDDSAAVFIQDLAKLYGVSVDTVKKDFGRGAMFTGKKAVSAGLADKVGSLEQVQQDLAKGKYPTRAADMGKGKTKAASTATTGGTVMTLAELLRSPLSAFGGAAPDEDVLAEADAAGRQAAWMAQATAQEARTAETERLVALAAAQQEAQAKHVVAGTMT